VFISFFPSIQLSSNLQGIGGGDYKRQGFPQQHYWGNTGGGDFSEALKFSFNRSFPTNGVDIKRGLGKVVVWVVELWRQGGGGGGKGKRV